MTSHLAEQFFSSPFQTLHLPWRLPLHLHRGLTDWICCSVSHKRKKIIIRTIIIRFTSVGNTKPKAEATTRSKKVSFMAEEVSVSKFEYNDEDLDEVTETDDEQDKNENDFK